MNESLDVVALVTCKLDAATRSEVEFKHCLFPDVKGMVSLAGGAADVDQGDPLVAAQAQAMRVLDARRATLGEVEEPSGDANEPGDGETGLTLKADPDHESVSPGEETTAQPTLADSAISNQAKVAAGSVVANKRKLK